MARQNLVKGARYRSGDSQDSKKIDAGFDRIVANVIHRLRLEAERIRPINTAPPSVGTRYYLKGILNSDGRPIPLEESFKAESLEEARRITDEKVRQYHKVEGCALHLDLFDTPNYPRTVLYTSSVNAKKDDEDID